VYDFAFDKAMQVKRDVITGEFMRKHVQLKLHVPQEKHKPTIKPLPSILALNVKEQGSMYTVLFHLQNQPR